MKAATKSLRLGLAIAALVLALASAAHAQSSLALDWWTVDGGGGTLSTGQFTLSGTIGQPDAGSMGAVGTFTLEGGFWPGLSVAGSGVVTRTWVGPVNGDWFNANNWSPAGVPGPYDTILLNGGTINLTAPVTIGGQFNWSGGTLIRSALTIASGGVLNIHGNVTLGNALTNAGTVNWLGGSIYLDSYSYPNAGPLVNLAGGQWSIQCDQSLASYNYSGANAWFVNGGTVQKTAGTGGTSIYIPFYNWGTLSMLSGTVNFSPANAYTQTGATLNFGLAGTGRATPLQINGNLRLDGTLSASLLNNYTPQPGDTIGLISCGALTSSFNSLNLPSAGNNMGWHVVYAANAVSLQVVSSGNPTAQITGAVTDNASAPVGNLMVFAYTSNADSLFLSATTDSSGQYVLNVTNGVWRVGVQGLAARGYSDVPTRDVVVSSANQVVNFVVQRVGVPTLVCERIGGHLLLSWPAAETNFMLEATTTLPPSGWTPVPEQPVIQGDRWTVTVELSGNARFFRLRRGSVGPPAGMVLISAGSFTMGNCMDPNEGDPGELPLHTVYVSAFYMDQCDITKSLWDGVYQWATNHGYSLFGDPSGKGTNHPVQRVNWYACIMWCNARSEKEGRVPAYYTSASLATVYRSGLLDLSNSCVNWSAGGYRLPTEAEWEKAARGGASGHRFPWSNVDTISENQANYYSTGINYYSYDLSNTGYNPTWNDGVFPYTSPVGYYAPNGYGLYDMAGNVWQWCWDWYGAYLSATQSDPHGPESGGDRVNRGGNWDDSHANGCRTAFRNVFSPVSHYDGMGFRCVKGF